MENQTNGGSGSPALPCSSFLRDAVEKRLAELRADCALKREIKRNAFKGRWANGSRTTKEREADYAPSDKYWDDRQAAAQEKATRELEEADAVLAAFIVEHRPMMGSEWIGNDHGRLCWGSFLGGMPIDTHYCQREEGHDGNCADEWPETKWVFRDRRGSWPKGCHSSRDVHEMMDRKNSKYSQP